jgi:hypothetical protein
MKLERQMNLLKKTLLATAVAAISTGAMAAKTTADATVNNVSQEGYSVTTGAVEVDANFVTVLSGVNWSKDDLITFTLEGATFAPGQALDFVNDTVGVASFTLLAQDDTSATFRVAQIINAGGNTATYSFDFGVASGPTSVTAPKIVLPTSGVAEGHEVKLTTVVKTPSGQIIDATSDDTAVIVKTAPQFSVAPRTAQTPEAFAQLNGSANGLFQTLAADKNGGPLTTPGVLAMTASYQDGVASLQVPFVVSEQDVTVNGPVAAFNNTDVADNGVLAVASPATTATSFADKSVTFTTAAATTVNFTATQGAGTADTAAIEAGKFYVDYVLRNNTGAEVKLNTQDTIGRIKLDSLSAEIPYLPVGDAVTPFVWVTNHGTLGGDIHATAMTVNGKVYDLGVVANAKPGLTKVDTKIVEALKAAGVNTQYETVNLELYIEDVNRANDGSDNVIGDVSVYAAYKHIGDSDRLQVPVYLSTEANKID